MLGERLDHTTLEQGVRTLCQAAIGEVAQRYDLDPERVRLLPAGILVLSAVSACLGLPLCIARGGLREGVILELMNNREPEPA
jgi:exopolyphosphatase/guanosine-5'-triphosphate,3'-diphosphate pyrophosphatase